MDAPHSAETTPVVSVIVPVYKTEKYLAECIESILAQTFEDFEMILVDDGSPDNSGKICDDYAARDSRIRVFHKPNGGVTSARRLGVECSRAEWITFVDSDDKLFPNALRDLLEAANSHPDADLVEGKDIRDALPKNTGKLRAEVVASDLEYAVELASYTETVFNPGPYAKIIRRNLFPSAKALDIPAEIRHGEDFLMCLRLASEIKQAVKIFTPVYFYRRTPGSVCATFVFSTLYCEMFVRETENSIPEGITGKFCLAWEHIARRFFIVAFLFTSDWEENSQTDYWRKVKKHLQKNFSAFSVGTKACLFFVDKPCQWATRRLLRQLLQLSLWINKTFKQIL